MSEEQKNNVPLIGEIFVEGEAPPQYYQAFLAAQKKSEDAAAQSEAAAGRAEDAAAKINVDQEYIETQVSAAGGAADIAAAAARDAAQSEQNIKGDAERAEDAAIDAEAAAKRAEEIAANVGSPVSYKAQNLTRKEQAQALENIGASTYYNTTREELEVEHDAINTEYIYGLYDALMTEYPDNVQKNEFQNDDGTFTNYEYVISTGDYSDGGIYQFRDGHDDIKKPKYLVMSGIDGHERKNVLSTYRFIRDVLRGHNVPQAFKEGVILHVLPVGCPWGFDNYKNENENGVNLENNFDCEWTPGTGKGSSVASEKETQAITKWLNANTDANLYISYHNSGVLNEIVAVLGDSNNNATDIAKKIALRGIDRVIPFWKDVIGYPSVFESVEYYDKNWQLQTGDRDTIFSYSASTRIKGSSMLYAQEKLSIPSFVIETPSYYGTSAEWKENDKVYQPEPIAAGAEALGNILIEFYKQSFFGEVENDMKEIDNKLGELAESMLSVSKGFRIESGVMVVEEDVLPEAGKINITIRVPCSNEAKTVDFHADSDTRATIEKTTGTRFVASYLANFYAPDSRNISTKVDMGIAMKYVAEMASLNLNNGWVLAEYSGNGAKNEDGLTFPAFALKAGTYHWIAYYWND